MQLVNAMLPTGAQLAALAADDSPEPIVMVNLLRFRERATSPDSAGNPRSGREAYESYAQQMRGIVERAGGRFVFAADAVHTVIGDVGEGWDCIGLVEYPSARAFVAIATSAEVHEASVDREAGLEGQILIMTRASALAGGVRA